MEGMRGLRSGDEGIQQPPVSGLGDGGWASGGGTRRGSQREMGATRKEIGSWGLEDRGGRGVMGWNLLGIRLRRRLKQTDVWVPLDAR